MNRLTPNARSASALDLAQGRDKRIREFGSAWNVRSALAANALQFKGLPGDGRNSNTGLRLSRGAQ